MATGRRRSTRDVRSFTKTESTSSGDAAGSRSGAATAGRDPAAHGGRLRAGSRPRRAADGGTVGGCRGTRACSVPGFLASGGVFFARASSDPSLACYGENCILASSDLSLACGGVCCIRASIVPSQTCGGVYCTSASGVPITSASDGAFLTNTSRVSSASAYGGFIAPAPAVSESPAPVVEHLSLATARCSRSVLRSPQMAEQLVDVPVPSVHKVTIMAPFEDTASRTWNWISTPDGRCAWCLATQLIQWTRPEGITAS